MSLGVLKPSVPVPVLTPTGWQPPTTTTADVAITAVTAEATTAAATTTATTAKTSTVNRVPISSVGSVSAGTPPIPLPGVVKSHAPPSSDGSLPRKYTTGPWSDQEVALLNELVEAGWSSRRMSVSVRLSYVSSRWAGQGRAGHLRLPLVHPLLGMGASSKRLASSCPSTTAI